MEVRANLASVSSGEMMGTEVAFIILFGSVFEV